MHTGNIGLLLVGFGIGMGLGGLIALLVDGIEAYRNWRLAREWRI